ncbi:MXAN_6640 family putative metalloprotease [Hugenholtzia roseola]|uniref:MXAN_6640 family putative metalloprotease n=1 Tax=Hugenholtzia roseola TaxID=1002 RepID=UPI000418004B|nr:MXAN_6640 family putative metalloprotease [Hugenholtzia roseola]
MKKYLLGLAIGLGLQIPIAEAQNSPNYQLSSELIAAFQEVQSHNHSHADGRNQIHKNCLTPLLLQVKGSWDELTDEAKQVFQQFEDRPSLASEQVVESEHFAFHFTLVGSDAIDVADNNGNGTPDYIEKMITAFEKVYDDEITRQGYIFPPSDEGIGGSDLYDVYIFDIGEGLYGYVQPEDIIGDNPNSSPVESNAGTSFMAMRHNYRGFGNQDVALNVTAAHEFFHAIQMGYRVDFRLRNPSAWIYESTAAWMEDEVFAGADDNLQYLPSLFDAPDVATNLNFADQGWSEFRNFQGHWYGGWILMQYIEEAATYEIIRKTWEKIRSEDEIVALNASLNEVTGRNLKQIFNDFSIASQLLTNSSGAGVYTFERAEDYKTSLRRFTGRTGVRTENNFTFSGTATTYSSGQGNSRLLRFSRDYIRLNTSQQKFKIKLVVNSSEVAMQLLKINSSTGAFEVQGGIDSKEIEVTNGTNFDQFFIIVSRYDFEIRNTNSIQYSLDVEPVDQTTEPTGIDNLAQGELVNLFPNPTTEKVWIAYELQTQESIALTVHDLTGRNLFQTQTSENKGVMEIPAQNLQKGSYLVSIWKEGQRVAVRRFVKE